MKKFLAVLIVFLLLLAGYLFFQRRQVARQLEDLAQGKTYSSYGLKIEIPPGPLQIRGLFKPYVNLSRVVVDLSLWGLKLPVSFEDARLSSELWRRGGLVLSFPRVLAPRPDLKIDHLAFELGLKDSIHGVRARQVEFKTASDASETLRLEGPEIFFGAFPGLIPDRFRFRLAKLVMSEKIGTPQAEEFQLQDFEINLVSEVRGNDRPWKLYITQKGAWGKSPEAELLEILPSEFKLQGSVKNLSRDEARASLPAFQQAWTMLAESAPSQDFQTWRGLLDQGVNFILRLQPEINTADFFWAGLKFSKNGKDRVLVRPTKGVVQVKFGEGQGLSQAKAHLEQVVVYLEKGELSLDAVDFSQSSQYLHVGYGELLKYLASYYLHFLSSGPTFGSQNLGWMMLSSLTQYPDRGNFEMKIGRLKWSLPESEGEHQNATLGFKLSAEGLEYYFQDEFKHLDHKNPVYSIEAGRVAASLLLKMPWEKLLDYARHFTADPQTRGNFAQVWAGTASGPQMKFDLDLGKSLFALQFKGRLGMDLEKPLQQASGALGAESLPNSDRWFSDLGDPLRKAFFAQGDLELSLKFERFSHLQAWLEKIRSGASLSLAVLAPYSVLDSKADTSSILIKMQGGQVLVNGQRNESLEKIIAPFKGE